MDYFNNIEQAVKVLEYAKQAYKDEHDKFHKFNMELLNIDCKKDDFFAFLKKIVIMDTQSRPQKLSKYKILKIFDGLEEKFVGENLKGKFQDEEALVEYLYEKLLSITNIGPKIAYLVIKNLVCFSDTEKYFGFKREKLLPLLKLPVDVHVKNLLCYRLQIVKPDLYDKIKPENKEFQEELKRLCIESKELNPVDLDVLWYIGYQNCNKRAYCNNCEIRKYCKDSFFEIETRKSLKDKNRAEKEIKFVKNHKEIIF